VSAVIHLLTPNNNNMVSTGLVAVMPYALYANTRDDLGSQRREGAEYTLPMEGPASGRSGHP